MLYPKFIITSDGFLRLGRVRLHLELLKEGEYCYGGGFYEIDIINNRMLLSGSSYDFGKPRWDRVDTLKVSVAYRGLKIVYQEEEEDEEIEISPICYVPEY